MKPPRKKTRNRKECYNPFEAGLEAVEVPNKVLDLTTESHRISTVYVHGAVFGSQKRQAAQREDFQLRGMARMQPRCPVYRFRYAEREAGDFYRDPRLDHGNRSDACE